MRVNRRGTGCGPCPSKQSHQGSPANEGRWQIHFLKKVLEGKNKKYLSFKSRTTSTLFILFVHYPGVSEDRVSRKIFNDSGLQTYANTFLISSPFFWRLIASNMLGLEVRFPLECKVSSLLGNKATCRDLEIMSFPSGRRCCSGSPENILSDWLVFYSPLSKPGVCC